MIGPSQVLAADNPNGPYIPAPHLRFSSPITTSSPILSICDTLAITCIEHHYLHLRRDICDIYTCFHHNEPCQTTEIPYHPSYLGDFFIGAFEQVVQKSNSSLDEAQQHRAFSQGKPSPSQPLRW
jgi:hypothetical protein